MGLKSQQEADLRALGRPGPEGGGCGLAGHLLLCPSDPPLLASLTLLQGEVSSGPCAPQLVSSDPGSQNQSQHGSTL